MVRGILVSANRQENANPLVPTEVFEVRVCRSRRVVYGWRILVIQYLSGVRVHEDHRIPLTKWRRRMLVGGSWR